MKDRMMRPFLAGKKSANGAVVPSLHLHGTRTAGINGSDEKHESTVELVKEGDKVVRLIVTCLCGERTEIDCLYPPGNRVN